MIAGLERSYAAEVDVDAGWTGVSGGQDSGVGTAAQTSRSRARSGGTTYVLALDSLHHSSHVACWNAFVVWLPTTLVICVEQSFRCVSRQYRWTKWSSYWMTIDARTDIWRARWSSKVKIISQNSRSQKEKMMLKWSGQCDFSSESFLVSCFFTSSIYAVSVLSFVAATQVLSVTCLRRVLSEILNVEQSSRRINATSNWILLQACAPKCDSTSINDPCIRFILAFATIWRR